MNISYLPNEIKLQILVNADLRTIQNLCRSNVDFYQLCNDQSLWHDLYRRDFGNKYPGLNDVP